MFPSCRKPSRRAAWYRRRRARSPRRKRGWSRKWQPGSASSTSSASWWTSSSAVRKDGFAFSNTHRRRMYNLHLSVEQLEIRDTVRDFVAQTIRPAALRPERLEAAERLPAWDLLEPASRMGLGALALSEQRGGAGADTLTCCLVAEELAAGDVDCAAMLNETSTLAHLLFDRLMTDPQRDRMLPQFLADDRYHLAFAGREPGSGAELGVNYHRPVAREAAMPITALRAANGEWIVNGASSRVANASVAKLVAVQAAAAERACALLVPRDTPGLSVRPEADARGWH